MSKIEIIHYAKIEEKKLIPNDRERLKYLVSQCPDMPVMIKIQSIDKTRSTDQNRYYWGVVMQTLEDHTGHTKIEMHEYCKHRFIPKSNVLGIEVSGSSRELKTHEFSKYVDQIRLWAIEELECLIPEVDSPGKY